MGTGDYAVTNRLLPWYKQPKQVKPKKKKKHKVIYPLFIQCSEIVTDPFWIGFFIDMSRNKLPKGFRIRGNNLVCHDRNKTKHVNLIGDTIEIASKCMQFLREVANIMSQNDKNEIRKAQKEAMERANIPKTWNDIKKKKSEKKAAIIQFSAELSKNNNLTVEESTDLLTLINLSYFLNKINSDDVMYNNGHIISINGLIKVNGKFRLDEEHEIRRYKFRDKEIRSNNLKHEYVCKISHCWAKFVARQCGLPKAKVLRAITTARSAALTG